MDSEKCFSQVLYVTVQLKMATYMPLENNHHCMDILGMLSSTMLTDTGTTSSAIILGI